MNGIKVEVTILPDVGICWFFSQSNSQFPKFLASSLKCCFQINPQLKRHILSLNDSITPL